MLTRTNITIYNRKYNSTSRLYEYAYTQISNVTWQYIEKATLTADGMKNADTFIVRIPTESQPTKTYIDSVGYKALTSVAAFWTVEKDDIIVQGLVSDTITGIADLKTKYQNVFKVTSFADNRFGGIPHWRIGGQ